MQLLINIFLSYLMGSISGSMVCGKLKGIDIRTMGSGNAGGTNALRSMGFLFALGVILIDISKGIIAVVFISNLFFIDPLLVSTELAQILCGLSAVIGHVYPIYYNFKGGKGAGTLIGIIGVLFPQSILITLSSWLIILILTGFVGLGTMIAGIVLVITTAYLHPSGLYSPFGYFSIIMALFIIYTHRSNIMRMINGTENRFEKIMIFKKLFSYLYN